MVCFHHPSSQRGLDADLVDRLIRQRAGYFRLISRQAMQRPVTGAYRATRYKANKNRKRGNDRIGC